MQKDSLKIDNDALEILSHLKEKNEGAIEAYKILHERTGISYNIKTIKDLELNLVNKKIGDDGAIVIATMLQCNHSVLKKLNLSTQY